MGVLASEHGGMEHIGSINIIDVTPLPGEQTRVLHALYAFAYPFQLLARSLTLTAGRNCRAFLGRGHHAASS
jgi:hypothetical protein